MKVVVSRLLVLLASAQAFQLQNNNNNDHHLVSLTHQPTQPLDNTILHLPLDNKPTTNKKKLLLSNFYSPQTAATQINRTVNRNTKNRQNQSKCSFDAPHSTLLDITTTTSHHHHHSNDGNNNKKNENIQRSLRQLGITIASTFLIVTQARVSVANAYTPLLVTHPSGVGSTAITPLLSTLPYHGMAIVPSMSLFNKMKVGGGLSPAVGEIVMSFAYVIIALGVSHYLMRVAEGGHVKMLKLLAWQNLADDDGSGSIPVASSSSKSSTTSTTKSNNKDGRGIQGLVSRYTYMVQLIFNEIRKAHRVGQALDPATTTITTTAPMTTTSQPNMMLSRYASLLNRSFQETYNKDHHQHPDNDDDGSTILTSWKEYSNLLQQKMTNKKKWKKQTSRTSSRSRVFGKGGLVYNKFAMMFERVAKSDDSEGRLFEWMLCIIGFVNDILISQPHFITLLHKKQKQRKRQLISFNKRSMSNIITMFMFHVVQSKRVLTLIV